MPTFEALTWGRPVRRHALDKMSINATVQIPVHVVLAIQGGTDIAALPRLREAATKALADAVNSLPYQLASKPQKRKASREILLHIFMIPQRNRKISLTMPVDSSIDDVKWRIKGLEEYHPSAQRLIWKGKQLEDARTLDSVSISLFHASCAGDQLINLN